MRCKTGLFSRYVPFSPTSIAGLTAWWDASDSSTLFNAASGGSSVDADEEIARIEDKSGNARHLANENSGARPLRKTGIRNGLDVMRFDGSNDGISSVDFAFTDICAETQCAFFCAMKASSFTSNDSLPYKNPAIIADWNAGQGFLGFRSNGTVESTGFDGTFTRKTVSLSYTEGEWNVFSVTHSSSTLSQRKNGGAAATVSLGTRAFATQKGIFMGRTAATVSPSQFLSCDVGEIITYNVALSATDREAVESYLMSKWAIT